jgi:serine/threonine-protein kinase
MSAASADRNLLFGILALQMDFIGRDALIAAMHAWVLDKAKPLGDILAEQGALTSEHRTLLDALVEAHLAQHGNDPAQSLAALSSLGPARQELERVADPDVQASLGVVASARHDGDADPWATRAPATAGESTSKGLRFRILRRHARGGLGEVFVARDEELHREVALKEIQPRFADHPHSRVRFLMEAEVTGGLEHPGVVPVYGLGTYADGRPFYAMRFIKGDSLKDAIKRFHTGPDGRPRKLTRDDFEGSAFRGLLKRFVDVCNAVAYAHSRKVLHRDLKPGNVMLGKYGETLVVDWGLAKPLGRSGPAPEAPADEPTLRPESASGTEETRPGQVVGTLEYMSPEQAAGRLDLLGPASDIYSLGATLYTALTGQARVTGKSETEVLRAVERGDWPPPRQVCPAVPPALEAVCVKALALRPEDRYASALDLATDVERWLADEPVKAYREPLSTRLRRWVRRHRPLVAAAAAAVVLAAAGLGALAWQKEQARRSIAAERDRALAARRRAREALDAMTSEVTGDALTTQKALSEEQRTFLEGVLGFYKEFAAEPGEDREGRERLAQAHFRLGMIHSRLGQAEPGVTVFRRAAEFYDRLAADHPGVPEYRQELAASHNNLGALLAGLGQRAEAEAEYRQALAVQEKLTAEQPGVPEYRKALARSHNNLGALLAGLGQHAEAEAAFRAALAVQDKLAADHPAVPWYRQELASSHYNLGILLAGLGQHAEAEAEYRAALAVRDKLAADHPAVPWYRQELAASHNSLGNLLAGLGRRAEAEAEYRAALAVRDKLAADHPGVPEYRQDLAGSHNNLGILLAGLGRRAEAEAEYRAALAVQDKLAADHPAVPWYRQELASSHNNLGILLAGLGRRAEAEAAFRAALAVREKLAADHPAVPEYRQKLVGSRLRLADLLARAGDHANAADEAELLAEAKDVTAVTLYDAACVFSLSSAAAKDGAAPADRYAARAVVLLRQAFAKGYANVAHMLNDSDLDPLRRRADYAALLWDLADAAPATPPKP